MTKYRKTAMTYEQALEGNHQFRVPSVDGNTLAMRVTPDGIIIELEDSTGEAIQTAYQLWSDLEDMTL